MQSKCVFPSRILGYAVQRCVSRPHTRICVLRRVSMQAAYQDLWSWGELFPGRILWYGVLRRVVSRSYTTVRICSYKASCFQNAYSYCTTVKYAIMRRVVSGPHTAVGYAVLSRVLSWPHTRICGPEACCFVDHRLVESPIFQNNGTSLRSSLVTTRQNL